MTPAGARPKVLWLVKGLGPGGAERLLVSAARVRDRAAFDVDVAYVLPWKDHLAGALAAEGVGVVCLGAASRWDPRWAIALRRRLRAQRYDVIHNHSPLVAAISRLVVRSLPAEDRPVLISTEHNTWSSHGPLTTLANRLTFGMDSAHIAVSDDTRGSIPARLRPQVETIVHGVVLADADTARAGRAGTRQRLGFTDSDVVITTVANYRSHKGYPDLLAAARMVASERPDVQFVAIGQGPLAAEIRQQRDDLGLADRFHLLGQRDDVLDVLAASDIFVLASRFEGYPVSVMEALAIGLPVVATWVGGIPDAVGDQVNGILVPPRQARQMADALTTVASDTGLRLRLAEEALRRGGSYDIGEAVRRMEWLYRDVLWGTTRSIDTIHSTPPGISG
jgi:glycosyltransferase involved in cell wall biosynthesis